MRAHVLSKLGLGALCAALVFLPAGAHAQLGGLIKKAGDKAAEKARNKTMDKSDGAKLGTEFTGESLDRVLTALETTANARRQSDSIGKIVEPLENQLRDLRTRSESEIAVFEKKKSTSTECRDNAARAFTAAHADQNQKMADQMAAKMKTDPAGAQRLIADMTKAQQASAVAMMKGDTVAAVAIMRDWYKKNGMESALGITAAELDAKCGSLPAAPASVTQRDQLEQRITALRTQQRESMDAAFAKAQESSGLAGAEFYQMNERIERWYAITVEGKKGAHFWSDEENALFEARRARIERVFKQLRA